MYIYAHYNCSNFLLNKKNKSHSLSFSLFHKPTNGAANGKHRPGQDEQLLKVVVWIFSFQLNPN